MIVDYQSAMHARAFLSHTYYKFWWSGMHSLSTFILETQVKVRRPNSFSMKIPMLTVWNTLAQIPNP